MLSDRQSIILKKYVTQSRVYKCWNVGQKRHAVVAYNTVLIVNFQNIENCNKIMCSYLHDQMNSLKIHMFEHKTYKTTSTS